MTAERRRSQARDDRVCQGWVLFVFGYTLARLGLGMRALPANGTVTQRTIGQSMLFAYRMSPLPTTPKCCHRRNLKFEGPRAQASLNFLFHQTSLSPILRHLRDSRIVSRVLHIHAPACAVTRPVLGSAPVMCP
jgi:hypothetical protein